MNTARNIIETADEDNTINRCNGIMDPYVIYKPQVATGPTQLPLSL